LLLHVYATFAVGGPQVRFAAIANHFGRRWRHAIIAMDGNTACRERLSPGLDVAFPDLLIRKGDTLGNVRRFRGVLKALRPSALVTSNFGSIEWAMANAVPLVPHIHIEDGFGPEERHSQIPRRVWLRRIFLRHSTVVLPSRVLWRIAGENWRLPARRLRYIPNGIPLTSFGAPTAIELAGKGPVIGTVAALRAEKNLPRLLRAFRLVSNDTEARLLIVGDGPERARLEALSTELGCSAMVRFVGHLARPESAYRSFDVFALSSDTEQMPLSVLEAMAAGLPVAATDVGDVRAMLPAENHAFVAPQDDVALADALRKLLRDPALRRRVGDANRARAEREFDEAKMFAAYAGLFDGARGCIDKTGDPCQRDFG
jgi:glycosyltransferase involved in cell wall biosynthesis